MVPIMAAMVLRYPVALVFLLVFPVCQIQYIFTREELLNIRQNTPQNLLLVLDYAGVLLDIVIGPEAAQIREASWRARESQTVRI